MLRELRNGDRVKEVIVRGKSIIRCGGDEAVEVMRKQTRESHISLKASSFILSIYKKRIKAPILMEGGRKVAIITKGGRRRRRIEASSIAYMSSTRERKKKHAQNKASSNHTQDLNHQQGEAESSTSLHDDLPTVRVETLEEGFRVNVFSEKNCPAMLVSVLEAFEQLGLDVLDARVSCEDTFQFEALGGSQSEEKEMDAQTVKQTVLQAINSVVD